MDLEKAPLCKCFSEKYFKDEKFNKISRFLLDLVNSVDQPVFVKDINHRFIMVNKAYQDFLGYECKDLFGKDDFDVLSKDEAQIIVDSEKKLFKTGGHISIKRSIKKSDGDIVFVNIKMSVIESDIDGKFIVCVINDITDVEISKHALSESESRFLKVFNSSPQAIFLIRSEDGKLLEVNDSALNIFAYKREDVLGRKYDDLNLLSPEDKDLLKLLLKEHNGYKDVEIPFFTKTGEKRFGLYSCDLVEIKGEACRIETVIDITERKLAEISLRNSEENYRLLSETMPLGIITVDLNGNITYINSVTLSLLGSPSKEITLSINVLEFPSLVESGISAKIKECLDTGTSSEFECPYTSIWNKNLYLHIFLTPIKSEVGHVVGVQVLAENVSKKKSVELKMEESEKKYKAVFETTGAATFIIENDFTLSFVNKKMELISGYSKEEIEGKMKWTDFVAQKDLDMMMNYHYKRRELDSSVPEIYEFGFLTNKRSELMEVLINISIIPGTNQSVASITDISGIKKVESALKAEHEARKELEYVLNQGPVVVIIFRNSKDWVVDFITSNVKQFGYNTDDFLSQNIKFSDIVHPDDLELLKDKLFSFPINVSDDLVLSFRILTKEASVVWVESRIWLKYNQEGEITHYQGVFFDITDRKNTEDKNFELYRHIGLVNRRVSILSDMNRSDYSESAKEKLDSITRSARNISQADVCLFYEFADVEGGGLNLLSVDVKDLVVEDDRINNINIADFEWLIDVMENKIRFQGNSIDHKLDQLNVSGAIKSFLFLPMVKNGKLFAGLFLGFSERVPINTQELAFYDLFVMHASIMMEKLNFIDL